jgi:hypothetical protein
MSFLRGSRRLDEKNPKEIKAARIGLVGVILAALITGASAIIAASLNQKVFVYFPGTVQVAPSESLRISSQTMTQTSNIVVPKVTITPTNSLTKTEEIKILQSSSTISSEITSTPENKFTTPELSSNYWHGEYFANSTFSPPATYEQDDAEINFNWKEGNPAPGLPINGFSIRWTRCSDFQEGTYRLTLRLDGGAKVYVDDTMVAESYFAPPIEFIIGAGRHCVRVDFWDAFTTASIYVNLELVSQPTKVVSSNPWHGEYFANSTFSPPATYEQDDAEINFNWKEGNPAPGLPINGFSIRWTRCSDFQEGTYRLTLRLDGGAKVYVDDTMVAESYFAPPIEFKIGAGRHCVRVDFWDAFTTASIYVNYELKTGP